MNADFTINVYKKLITRLQEQGFNFLPFNKINFSIKKKLICLRHDVDLLPNNSLLFAKIQSDFGISATYYFRAIPQSWNESVIKEIHNLGHEVGYHYECLFTTQGNMQQAILDFEKNLEEMRRLVPVNTICMHGSPRSKWDSKELWKHFNYRDYGIIGEPYFDTDFSKVAYYTDTGRMWAGFKYSVRDKVFSNVSGIGTASTGADFPMYHTTTQMIRAIQAGEFPNKAMLTFHPQRWTNKTLPWLKELLWQRTKNSVKYFLVRVRE